MTVKTITVTEDAYNVLKGMKQGDESFSDLIKRIGSQKRSVLDFVGILRDSETSAGEFQKTVKESRIASKEAARKRHAMHFKNGL